MRFSLRRPGPDSRPVRRTRGQDPGRAHRIHDSVEARRLQLDLDVARLPRIL